MLKLTRNERKILALAYTRNGIEEDDCMVVFRSIQHIRFILTRLKKLLLLKETERGGFFVITPIGQEVMLIEDKTNVKLEKFIKK